MSVRQDLRFPPTLAAFAEASSALGRLLDAESLRPVTRRDVELAFEEVVANVVRHGRPQHDVHVMLDVEPDEVVLTFEDDGVPFDPTSRPDPVLASSIDDAKVGGLGILMVRNLSTRMTYTRTADHRNRLVVGIAK